MDLPVTIDDVDSVLEDHGPLHERDVLVVVDLLFEIGQVAGHLGNEPLAPPGREVRPVRREHGTEVGTDLGGVLRIVLWDTREVDVAEFRRRNGHVRVARNGCRVEVAVDDLLDPVGRERRAEPAEHVIAGVHPVGDVVIHRRHGAWAVQVVIDPEQLLLLLRFPFNGEVLVSEELRYNLAVICHAANLLPRRTYAGTGPQRARSGSDALVRSLRSPTSALVLLSLRRSDRLDAKPSLGTARSSLQDRWCGCVEECDGSHAHIPETAGNPGVSERIRQPIAGTGRVVTERAITMARLFSTPARIILDNRLLAVYGRESRSVNLR